MKYIILILVLFLTACSENITVPQGDTGKIAQSEIQTGNINIILEPNTAMNTQNIDKEIDNALTEDTCYLFEDFSDVEQYRWGVVNDGVMGGKSQGSAEIVDDTLVFSGEIVTKGGGFSSLRGKIESGELTEYSSVQLRAKSDGREYRITLRDNQWGNISHRAVLDFQTPGEFEEVTINLADLQPAYFGRSVKADSFSKGSAREIGIILSDGVDGGFELVIDEVRLCR